MIANSAAAVHEVIITIADIARRKGIAFDENDAGAIKLYLSRSFADMSMSIADPEIAFVTPIGTPAVFHAPGTSASFTDIVVPTDNYHTVIDLAPDLTEATALVSIKGIFDRK